MPQYITFSEHLTINNCIIDVRSPSEFAKAHIPGAINIPLFSDQERAKVGTAYKQISKEKAIEIGYQFVTPKLDDFVTKAIEIAPSKIVTVHCWRGGMRSAAFAKHLIKHGFKTVYVLTGGYKSFRNHVLNAFAQPAIITILGGYTGSGKTYILELLKKKGVQTIDLEGIAHHKGSAFGTDIDNEQPTSQQFENNLFWQWKNLDLSQPIWLEDESLHIGKVGIPLPLYNQMRTAKTLFLNIPKEKRAAFLATEYKNIPKPLLERAVLAIKKRLGGHEKKVLEYIAKGEFEQAALILLNYYDKAYLKGLLKREDKTITKLLLNNVNHKQNTAEILKVKL